MSISNPASNDPNKLLKVFTLNVWGLAFISKDRAPRIKAIAEYISTSTFDIVCLQELWIYKDYEIVRDIIGRSLPFSRFFHTGALGSGLAIFTRFPLISAQALPYSLSGSPAQAIEGDFFVKKAAANVTVLHPLLGEIEIWTNHGVMLWMICMRQKGNWDQELRKSRWRRLWIAHRISQSWQLANNILSGAAKGRYILAMGDFNAQPYSLPISILRSHACLSDSFLDTHPNADQTYGDSQSSHEAIKQKGMTCDSLLNTYSAGKNIPENVLSQGGKRLDYIFYRQPAVARRRPLIWGYRDDEQWGEGGGGDGLGGGEGGLEEGKPMGKSMDRAPVLRCLSSEVVLTEKVPNQPFSYSDHFGLFSTFAIDVPSKQGVHQHHGSERDGEGEKRFTPLVPLLNESEAINDTTSTFAPISPPARSPKTPTHDLTSPMTSTSSSSREEKSTIIRNALNTLRMYTEISERTAVSHLRYFVACVVGLVVLTVGSAWQPKSWLQPLFTLVGGAFGAGGATFLYTGFVWGRWEKGLLTEVTEEMELELRVVEMEENAAR